MHKFLIEPGGITETAAVIEGQDARHILRVLRLGPGDAIEFSNGIGTDFTGRIATALPGKVTVDITGSRASRTESALDLTVCSGMLKHQKMDGVIKALTQLGVTRWIPFFCERSIPTPDKKASAKRLARWQTIAKESVKQCRRSRLVEIVPPQAFKQVLDGASGSDLCIAFWENADTPLSGLASAKKPSSVTLLIGPEGGFSQDEIARATANGFAAYTLGPRILRAETAAVCAAALIQHLMGDI